MCTILCWIFRLYLIDISLVHPTRYFCPFVCEWMNGWFIAWLKLVLSNQLNLHLLCYACLHAKKQTKNLCFFIFFLTGNSGRRVTTVSARSHGGHLARADKEVLQRDVPLGDGAHPDTRISEHTADTREERALPPSSAEVSPLFTAAYEDRRTGLNVTRFTRAQWHKYSCT